MALNTQSLNKTEKVNTSDEFIFGSALDSEGKGYLKKVKNPNFVDNRKVVIAEKQIVQVMDIPMEVMEEPKKKRKGLFR